MAIQPRISTLRFDNGLGSFRQWQATAAVQDTAAGQSVEVTVVHTTGGTPPGEADGTSQLRLVSAAGVAIRTFTVPTAAGTNSFTFHFTSDGTSGGAARCGTVEIVIDMQRTTVVTYDAESDGSPSTAPTGFTMTSDRGWIRGTTSCTLALSNISAGGAKDEPASYNEDVYVRSTLGHVSYDSRTLTLGVTDSAGGPAQIATSGSATAVTRDATLAGIVDDRYTAAARTFTSTVAVPNDSSLATGQGWTSLTSTTTDTLAADPRITITHHLQLNDNTYDSGLATTSRLTSDLGFATWVALNARGEPINGLAATHSLGDTANLSADAFSASETSGATGRPASMQTWDASLPGGSWTHSVVVTTADATGLASPETEVWTLLAVNPNYRVIVGGGPYEALRPDSDKDHWHPGEPILLGLAVLDIGSSTLLTPDVSPPPAMMIGRFNQAFGRAEYYDPADDDWHSAGSGATIATISLSASPGDGQVYIAVLPALETTDWNWADLFLVGIVYISGTPYSGPAPVPVMGDFHGHNLPTVRMFT